MTQRFDWTLTQQDLDLTTEFMMYCDEHGLDDFTSDTFREAGLDRGMQDPAHEIGAYFAKLKANGVASPVSEVASVIPSNNERRVDVWRWNWQRWREIIQGRLETYSI